MSWTKITVTDYNDLAAKVSSFVSKTKEAGTPSAGGSNTGNGTVYGASADISSVVETWTLTCTTGGASAVFSVVGSVTGAKADATVNTPYVNGYCNFTIIGGSTNFVTSDSFTISISTITANWSVLRSVAGSGSTVPEYIWKGIGGGSDEIIVGIKGKTDTSNYWNWDLQGFTGYVSGSTFENQPGYHSSNGWGILYGSSFTCYIFESNRRLLICPIIGTVYQTLYLGWWEPFASPSQYNYPMMIGGSSSDSVAEVSDTFNCWWNAGYGYILDGSWISIKDQIWPMSESSKWSDYEVDVNSDRLVVPITIFNTGTDSYIGEAEGLFGVVVDSSLTINDYIKTDEDEFLVIFQNVTSVGNADFVGIKLI